ncbi:2-phosphosulfolactate phosphatase, partial [Clostridioides difficile]
ISKTANMIYENNSDIISYVKEATHYSVMKSLELDNDIEYCIKKSIVNNVPEYKDGKIVNM